MLKISLLKSVYYEHIIEYECYDIMMTESFDRLNIYSTLQLFIFHVSMIF